MIQGRKLFDCILYNGEIEVLLLRLGLMSPFVDRFIILESPLTFSNRKKELAFPAQKHYLKNYLQQIDYRVIDDFGHCRDAWDREHHVRNRLRDLAGGNPDDLIIISDTDEILNLQAIADRLVLPGINLIQLSTYYGFINLRSTEKIQFSLLADLQSTEGHFLGDRTKYKLLDHNLIEDYNGCNGGHFTYQFGYKLDLYRKKIQGFSHQEFNTERILSKRRIKKCLNYQLDILERYEYRYELVGWDQLFISREAFSGANIEQTMTYRKRSVSYHFHRLFKYLDPYFIAYHKIPIRIFLSRLKKCITGKKSLRR
ncbi:MAG: hypothetical protein CSA96_05240 [Bacteroidetes bacterium]|nr:MAG: hypothetical protein CSA96_05240 [Bacteroidota bacterium]